MRIKISARLVGDHTCNTCGRVAEADRDISLEANSVNELLRQVSLYAKNPPRSTIPVGWSSNGSEGVTCYSCEEKARA